MLFKTMFKLIDRVNEKIGNIICFLIILIMFTIGTVTISRYFFNEPLTVVWPVIRQLFGIFVLLGAAYTLLNDRHIRVDQDQFDCFFSAVRSCSGQDRYTSGYVIDANLGHLSMLVV